MRLQVIKINWNHVQLQTYRVQKNLTSNFIYTGNGSKLEPDNIFAFKGQYDTLYC